VTEDAEGRSTPTFAEEAEKNINAEIAENAERKSRPRAQRSLR
jgi:hypothetical protein